MTEVLQLRHVGDERVGRYDLLETIGVGGMGKVYLAQREGTPHVCVLKRVLVELKNRASVLQRFQREAWIATLLDHPGIATTIDAGFDDDAFYIAMEFIGGVDLFEIMKREWMRRQPAPLDFAVTVAMRALEALAYAHDARGPEGELSLVHRDLSPKNLMVTFAGAVKIIDFGVAHANLGDHRTKTGVLLGTLRYVSPEQAMGHKVDRRSDLYAVAVLLYEMLAGRQMIADGEMRDMLRKIVLQEIEPLRSINPEVPEALASVIERGLQKAPEDRWPDASLFLAELKAAAPGLELDAARLAETVRAWFPEAEARAEERMALGRTRYERASSDLPEQFLATKTVPRPSRRVSRDPLLKRITLPLAGLSLMLLAAAIAQRPAPEPGPVSAQASAAAPQIVQRTLAVEEEPEKKPAEIPPPIPATRQRPAKPRPDLDQVLERRGLVRADLVHQHALDGLRARLASSDPHQVDAAVLELASRTSEISFERSALDERVLRIHALLKQTELERPDMLELERRFLDASAKIAPTMDRETFRETCAALDALATDLEKVPGHSAR